MMRFDVQTNHRDAVEIAGTISVAAVTGAVAVVEGVGFAVANTSAGKKTLTFTESWARLLAGDVQIELAAGGGYKAQLGPFTPADKTLVLYIWDIGGAALADVACNLHFTATVSKKRT